MNTLAEHLPKHLNNAYTPSSSHHISQRKNPNTKHHSRTDQPLRRSPQLSRHRISIYEELISAHLHQGSEITVSISPPLMSVLMLGLDTSIFRLDRSTDVFAQALHEFVRLS